MEHNYVREAEIGNWTFRYNLTWQDDRSFWISELNVTRTSAPSSESVPFQLDRKKSRLLDEITDYVRRFQCLDGVESFDSILEAFDSGMLDMSNSCEKRHHEGRWATLIRHEKDKIHVMRLESHDGPLTEKQLALLA